MLGLRYAAAPQKWRLLRLLFLRLGAVSAAPERRLRTRLRVLRVIPAAR